MTGGGLGSEVTVYDRLVWPDGMLEALLASGERRRELISYLGPDEYAALVPLARAAAAAMSSPPPPGALPVVLIPGVMGSQLGVKRAPPLPVDLLWLDPVDFQRGGLWRLALDSGDAVESCGPVVYSYLRLKLALEARGLRVRVFDYDWRHDVHEIGRRLALRLAEWDFGRCDLVCHSLGGLVARAALAPDIAGARIRRVVTLGTPHAGAYASLQALRGVYGTVRRLAQLDPRHTAEELAEAVFAGFPSLYDLLPRGANPDWLDPGTWPREGPRARAAELRRAAARVLPEAPERLACIVGTGKPTVTAARVVDGEVRYAITSDGDGTVPVSSAALADHPCRYAPLAHSDLPRDGTVARAVLELLRDGTTALLDDAPARAADAAGADADGTPVEVAESALRARFTAKLDWHAMTPEERRTFLDGLNDPLGLP